MVRHEFVVSTVAAGGTDRHRNQSCRWENVVHTAFLCTHVHVHTRVHTHTLTDWRKDTHTSNDHKYHYLHFQFLFSWQIFPEMNPVQIACPQRITFGIASAWFSQLQRILMESMNNKKALRETQTLRAGCSKAEPKIFALLQIPSRGCRMAKI